MKSFALRFQENYYVCIPYKFLEVAGYSDIHNGFISFSRISYSYLIWHTDWHSSQEEFFIYNLSVTVLWI